MIHADRGLYVHEWRYVIYGTSNVAIAETAAFFLSLKSSEESSSRFELFIPGTDRFDVAAFAPEQLAHIFDANPTRVFELKGGIWSAKQSLIFATRSYPFSKS